MLGKGVRCRRNNQELLRGKVQQFVSSHPSLAPGWTQQQVATAFNERGAGKGVYLYQRMDNQGYEQVSTSSYRPKSRRQNCHVLLQQDGLPAHIGCVQRLLGVQLPDDQQVQLDRDLRLALVDVFTAPQDTGGLMRIPNKHVPLHARHMQCPR